MRPLMFYKGKVRRDEREWFSFVLPNGKKAETKAFSREEAKAQIEATLEVQIQEAA